MTSDASDSERLHDDVVREALASKSEPVSAPSEHDVVCGRGKSVARSGNQRFRKMVQDRKAEYLSSRRREEKTRITCEIVDALRSGPNPAKFLLKDPESGLWLQVGDVYAREKVSHALRSRPNEERRRKPKPRDRATRKPQIPPELEVRVQSLIREQQSLLKTMIEREVLPSSHFDCSAINGI